MYINLNLLIAVYASPIRNCNGNRAIHIEIPVEFMYNISDLYVNSGTNIEYLPELPYKYSIK